jgi:hypothetical protein
LATTPRKIFAPGSTRIFLDAGAPDLRAIELQD